MTQLGLTGLLPKGNFNPAAICGVACKNQVRLYSTDVPAELTQADKLQRASIRKDNSVYGVPNFKVAANGRHAGNMNTPDWDIYRRDSKRDSTKSSKETHAERQNFNYLVTAGLNIGFAYAATKTVNTFLGYLSVSRDLMAVSTTEITLSDVPMGRSVTMKYRGKPLFIKHRYKLSCSIINFYAELYLSEILIGLCLTKGNKDRLHRFKMFHVVFP